MKPTNETVIGRQWRDVPEPSECKHMTVYGTETLTTFECKCCGGTFLLSEQYKSHKGHCCGCWNKDTIERSKRKGYKRVDYVKKSEVSMTLEMFFDESVDNSF